MKFKTYEVTANNLHGNDVVFTVKASSEDFAKKMVMTKNKYMTNLRVLEVKQ